MGDEDILKLSGFTLVPDSYEIIAAIAYFKFYANKEPADISKLVYFGCPPGLFQCYSDITRRN